jgi:hypothetical protein
MAEPDAGIGHRKRLLRPRREGVLEAAVPRGAKQKAFTIRTAMRLHFVHPV